MDWLRKVPVVCVLIAVAMMAMPFILTGEQGATETRFESARDDARDFFVHNSRLAVDALGETILDAEWLEEARAASDASTSSASVELPMRMIARSQAKLDRLIETAHTARMNADPAWRLGVLDARTPPENFLAHAFVHESIAGVILCIAVLLLVGAPLERIWGSGIFAAFCLIAIPVTAQGYRFLDAGSGIPWSGGAGLAGALLGAYCIRGLGGQFVFPGWVLLPLWLGVESLVVRSFWIDDLGGVPWASFAAAVGFGSLVAGGLRLVGVESALESRVSNRRSSGPNPILARTARLRSDGDPYQAFDLIQAAWRDNPSDREVAEAFFSIAVEVNQAEAAADAILPSLHESLRAGDMPRALEYWIPVATSEADVKLESTAAVRLGEALLDAGHPEQAIFTLRGALDSGVSSAHALRIVRVARDLDESLAREAAAIALADRTLDPLRRAELQTISEPEDENEPSGVSSQSPPPASPPLTDSQLGRRVAAEHQTVETTAFPLGAAADVEGIPAPGPEPDPDIGVESRLDEAPTEGFGSKSAHETQLMEQNLDQGALRPESFEDAAADAPGETKFLGSESGDVLSHWNDPKAAGDTIADLDADLASEGELLGESDLELFDESLDLSGADESRDALDAETDTDLTPMMEASEELTNPYGGSSPADELTVFAPSRTEIADPAPGSASLGRSAMLIAGDQPTTIFGSNVSHDAAPPESPTPSTADPADSADPAETVIAGSVPVEKVTSDDEFAIGVEGPHAESATVQTSLRALKAIDAVPVHLHDEWIDIEVDGRGKSKLPIARIEAIVVAGISGLASRPVLLVDFALNWKEDPAEPLKVIRFRSDRFDPRHFEPGEMNPLEALTAWVRRLQIRSEATCLPSRAILQGQFARYGSVEEYESEVLTAMREV